jgi:hypothetical protein
LREARVMTVLSGLKLSGAIIERGAVSARAGLWRIDGGKNGSGQATPLSCGAVP